MLVTATLPLQKDSHLIIGTSQHEGEYEFGEQKNNFCSHIPTVGFLSLVVGWNSSSR